MGSRSRQFSVLEAGKIVERLFACRGEITALGLLLNQQLAFPEQVEEAAPSFGKIDAIFKASHPAAGDAKKLEELIIKSLRVALFVVGIFPFVGELRGPRTNIIPIKPQLIFPQAQQ